MGKSTDNLVAEIEHIRKENFEEVYASEFIQTLAQLKHTDRPVFEKRIKQWRDDGVRAISITKLERTVEAELKRVLKANEVKKLTAPVPEDEDEDSDFTYNDKGQVARRARNIRLALNKLGVRLSFNEFNGLVYVEGWKGRAEQQVIDDAVLDDLWVAVDDNYNFQPSKEQFGTVLGQAARLNRFHPVRDYLGGLKWDKKPRLSTWLIDYMGAEDTPFNRCVARLFLKAAIKRVMEPGCKFDEMLLLQGPQGLMKSTAIQVLAVDPLWFSDSMPMGASEQKTIEASRGKWLVEISDLKGNNRVEVEEVKAMLSTQVDRARMAYARLPIDVPRQFVIFGTTNVDNPLADLTGNRRYWIVICMPVKDGTCDIEGLTAMRDQLWAEAIEDLAFDPDVRLPKALWPAAVDIQNKATKTNLYEESLSDHLDGLTGFVTSDALWEVLNVPTIARQRESTMFGAGMKALGWHKKQRMVEGKRFWGYLKGLDSEARLIGVQRSESGRWTLGYTGAAQEQGALPAPDSTDGGEW